MTAKSSKIISRFLTARPADYFIELHFDDLCKIDITNQNGKIGLMVSKKYLLLKYVISAYNFNEMGNDNSIYMDLAIYCT